MSAYLVYATDKQGRISLVWSKTPIDGALLQAIPKKTVPEFKFKTNKGASELLNNLQDDKKKYFQGIASFVKAVRAFDCSLKTLPGEAKAPLPFQVVLLNSRNEVTKLSSTEVVLPNFTCVAAVPKDCQDFEAKTLDRLLFLSKATQGGGASEPF